MSKSLEVKHVAHENSVEFQKEIQWKIDRASQKGKKLVKVQQCSKGELFGCLLFFEEVNFK